MVRVAPANWAFEAPGRQSMGALDHVVPTPTSDPANEDPRSGDGAPRAGSFARLPTVVSDPTTEGPDGGPDTLAAGSFAGLPTVVDDRRLDPWPARRFPCAAPVHAQGT